MIIVISDDGGLMQNCMKVRLIMQTKNITQTKVMTVTSSAFRTNGSIPAKYTCKGENINPPLDISDIPPNARSLALIIDDPDAPGGTWLHWAVWNIPVTHHLQEDDIPGQQARNDFRRNTYGGPCPPSGKHRYFFKIYALDEVLDLAEGATFKELESAMADHIVGYGELVGRFSK